MIFRKSIPISVVFKPRNGRVYVKQAEEQSLAICWIFCSNMLGGCDGALYVF